MAERFERLEETLQTEIVPKVDKIPVAGRWDGTQAGSGEETTHKRAITMKSPRRISWKSTTVLYFAFLSLGLLAIIIATFFSPRQKPQNTSTTATAGQSTDIAVTTLTGVVVGSTTDIMAVTTSTTLTKTVTSSVTNTPMPISTLDKSSNPNGYVYVFPVQATEIHYGLYHHDYPATDIFCPTGSKFVAPTHGEVDFVSREDLWDPSTDVPAIRGGLSVAIIGDDGWRYYGSHLETIAEGIEPGVRVNAGQLLGLTGQSGDARFTPPHLHFGISHPTTPEDWKARRGQIPPFEFLRAWERGEMVTPHP